MPVIKRRRKNELMISDTAISFDFWNTLYADGAENIRMDRRKALFKNIVTAYRSVPENEINTAFDLSFEYFITEWKDKMRTPTAAERISLMIHHLKMNLPEIKIQDLAEEFGGLIMEIPPLEITGVKRIVRMLAEEYPLGIISDTGYISGRHIREFLEKEGILDYFSSFMFSDEQDHSKPHFSVFKKTAEQLNIPLNRLIHIGDLERTDVRGALNAGCQSIKFTGANHRSTEKSQTMFVAHTYESVLTKLKILIS